MLSKPSIVSSYYRVKSKFSLARPSYTPSGLSIPKFSLWGHLPTPTLRLPCGNYSLALWTLPFSPSQHLHKSFTVPAPGSFPVSSLPSKFSSFILNELTIHPKLSPLRSQCLAQCNRRWLKAQMHLQGVRSALLSAPTLSSLMSPWKHFSGACLSHHNPQGRTHTSPK